MKERTAGSIGPGPDATIAVRRFSRFYTRRLGLLGEGLLDSAFSLTESRVLYELAHQDGLTASLLGRELGLDPGYLSRILKKFEARGLIVRAPSTSDGRQAVLGLTEAGRAAFAPLDRGSRDQVMAMLGRLDAEETGHLTRAMATVEALLGERPAAPPAPIVLRSHQIGDIGWITHRQALLYAQEYGWDESYEALVAEIGAQFLRAFDPQRDRAWIAEREGTILGSVFVVRVSDEIARLRLLYVEPGARGSGLGRRLVGECIRFARHTGYRKLTLWTNDVLTAARRIYQEAGFTLVAEERHHSFGKDLVGQNWELAL
ncbi:MAG TPA: helix-turn-helix domain-containing GNAT family N-acetyltransferase [Acetobacteraceae bacterium]|nr:helix-turn-helix domain-containing GNAT family N-acetyltransferase [Acetobacteraceae bacterium]